MHVQLTWAPSEGVLMRSCCRRPCRCGVDSMAVPGVSPSCPAAGVRAARYARNALCSLVVPATTGPREPVNQHFFFSAHA